VVDIVQVTSGNFTKLFTTNAEELFALHLLLTKRIRVSTSNFVILYPPTEVPTPALSDEADHINTTVLVIVIVALLSLCLCSAALWYLVRTGWLLRCHLIEVQTQTDEEMQDYVGSLHRTTSDMDASEDFVAVFPGRVGAGPELASGRIHPLGYRI